MGLENLKSVFSEGLNTPTPSKLEEFPTAPINEDLPKGDYYKSKIGNDLLGEGKTQDLEKKGIIKKYSDTRGKKPNQDNLYLSSNGKINDSRRIIKDAIPNYNNYQTIPESFKSSEGPLIDKKNKDKGWEMLYNRNHTPIKPWPGITYSPYVNTSNLDIKNHNNRIFLTGGGLMRSWFSPSIFSEPYMVSNIPRSDGPELSDGRNMIFGNGSIIGRLARDTLRITKYLTSPSGLEFIARQNISAFVPTSVVRKKSPGGVFSPSDKLRRVPQRFNKFYSPLSTLASVATSTRGNSPIIPVRRDFEIDFFNIPILGADSNYRASALDSYGSTIDQTFDGGTRSTNPPLFETIADAVLNNPKKQTFGDKMTLAPMIKGPELGSSLFGTVITDEGGSTQQPLQQIEADVEAKKEGMPFYFKDLRDDTYVFFRAYIDSINETVTPIWNPMDYVGRSESSWTYSKADRIISIGIKLAAHTDAELRQIYRKINRLTSMCYPEYKKDVNMKSKTRMKPPIVKFRLGELFGSQNAELTGFFQSLTYDIPPESTWETKKGQRVPRLILVNFVYFVIHSEAPNLDFALPDKTTETFYGITNRDTGIGVD
jgi:hypothetical protein